MTAKHETTRLQIVDRMHGKLKYEFSAKMWQYAAQGGWHFVSMPEELAIEIRDALKSEEEGWGRLKATALIGTSEWETAVWFDTKLNTYLLPVKAAIRNREQIKAGADINVSIWL